MRLCHHARLVAIMAAGALSAAIAGPALAQNAVPADGPYGAPYAPPPPGYGPVALAAGEPALPREAWLAECQSRLTRAAGADVPSAPQSCLAWWSYYTNGGRPYPHDGYAVPVVLAADAPECHPREVVERRVIRRAPARGLHDKRIKIVPY